MILLSPTECLIFCGNCTQGQGMSWDESLHYVHQLISIHPWTGYMIEVTAHQQTLKEAQHEMQVAREFTHERTKQRIAHLNALAMAPAARAQPAMPQRSPRGRGMTRWANRFFVQQKLWEMNFNKPAFVLVWGVHDLPVAQHGPVRPAAEANGIHPCLLQLHGTDNGHPKRAPWQPLQAKGVGKYVQRLLLCGALAREPPCGGSLEGPAPHHPFGPIEGAAGEGGE